MADVLQNFSKSLIDNARPGRCTMLRPADDLQNWDAVGILLDVDAYCDRKNLKTALRRPD